MTFGSGGGWTNIERRFVSFGSSGAAQLLYQCPANTMAFIYMSHVQSNGNSAQSTAYIAPLAFGGYTNYASSIYTINSPAAGNVRFITRTNMNISGLEQANRLVGYNSSSPWIYLQDSDKIVVDVSLIVDTGFGIVFQLLEQSIS